MVCPVYHVGMASLKKILALLLDCVMPPYDGVRELESMSATAFIEAADTDDASKAGRALPIEGLVAAFPYRARLVKVAIVEIKTNMNRPVARLLAEATYMKIKASLEGFALESIPLLAPMPMTNKRRRERGWNQCELICAELARIDARNGRRLFEYVPDALARTRETEDQVGMGKAERAANMKGSFAPGKGADGTDIARGRDVIILDDVATTGSTLREARQAAIDGGAQRVLLVAIGY